MSDDLFQLMMSSSLITLLFSPFLISQSRPIATWIDTVFGGDQHPAPGDSGEALNGHVVVIGYGVAGRNVAKDLLDTGRMVLVIDMSPVGVKEARELGTHSILGNAQRREVLEHSGIRTAKLVVITLPDHRASSLTIQQIRSIAEAIPIVARARYSIHRKNLAIAGAEVVVDEEECVGHSLAKETLEQLGM